MSVEEMVDLLVEHGCPDVTSQLDHDLCGKKPIAGGGFGDVYLGVLKSRKKAAIKCPRLYEQQDKEAVSKILKRTAREIHTWSRLKHQNILPLLGLAIYGDRISMVSPWMRHGSLLEYIECNRSVDRYRLLLGISDGVVYLHQNDVVHGDIKASNVLVSSEGIVKLADFGCSRLKWATLGFTTTTSDPGFSSRWTAPELLNGSIEATKEADVYAVGMTLLEVLTGKLPFHDIMSGFMVFKMVAFERKIPERPKSFASFNSREGDLLWKLMMDAWAYEPSGRPDSLEVRARLERIAPYKSELGSPLSTSIPNGISQQSLIPMVVATASGNNPMSLEPLPSQRNNSVPFPSNANSGPIETTQTSTSTDHGSFEGSHPKCQRNQRPIAEHGLVVVAYEAPVVNTDIDSNSGPIKDLTTQTNDTGAPVSQDYSLGSIPNLDGDQVLWPMHTATPPDSNTKGGKISTNHPTAPESSSRNHLYHRPQYSNIKPLAQGEYSRPEKTGQTKGRGRPKSTVIVEETGYMPDSDRKPSDIRIERLRKRSSRRFDGLHPRNMLERNPTLGLFKPVVENKQQPTLRWSRGILIGQDCLGVDIYRGDNLTAGKKLVIKQAKLQSGNGKVNQGDILVEALRHEANTLNRLNYPSIVQYLGFDQTASILSIFFEYVSDNSIASLVQKHGKFGEEVVRYFSRQIIGGIFYLHGVQITHSRLKSGNILVDQLGMCKISDFAFSKLGVEHIYDGHESSIADNIFWMAPELLYNSQGTYNCKVDIWSLGCIITEMQSGRRPWDGYDRVTVKEQVGKYEKAPPLAEDSCFSPLYSDFRQRCFIVRPANRPAARDLKPHLWLQNSPDWVFGGF